MRIPAVASLVHADKPFGMEFYQSEHIGSRMWVWLNDQLVVDGAEFHPFFDKSKPMPNKGPIHLQTHGGEIRWRNVYVRELDPEEANQYLRGDEFGTGFEPIFNGRNLEGWFGDMNGKNVSNGILRWTDGGHIYTNEMFTFRLSLRVHHDPWNEQWFSDTISRGNPAYDVRVESRRCTRTLRGSYRARQFHGSV